MPNFMLNLSMAYGTYDVRLPDKEIKDILKSDLREIRNVFENLKDICSLEDSEVEIDFVLERFVFRLNIRCDFIYQHTQVIFYHEKYLRASNYLGVAEDLMYECNSIKEAIYALLEDFVKSKYSGVKLFYKKLEEK